jgi:serine/threonine-protein kinase
MEESQAVDAILQVCDVLALAGRFGMVHRDLKPENIIITRDGSAMLLDFGIAKATERLDSLVTMANTVFGTPSYIAPEQAADSSAVSPSADVYSLGIMLFEMLAGRTPWTGKSPVEIMMEVMDPKEIPDVRTLAPSVSAETADILRRMCTKKAEERLQSADAVIEEFAKCGHTAKINSGRKAAAEETEESMDALLAKYGNIAAADDGPATARRSKLPWLAIAIAAAIAATTAVLLLVIP